MSFSSFHAAKFVLDEADGRFAPQYRPVPERLDIFRQYCAVIDGLMMKFGGKSLEVEVREDDMTVHMEMALEDLVVDDGERAAFTQLIGRSLSFGVRSGGEDAVLLHLVFPSLWEKAV